MKTLKTKIILFIITTLFLTSCAFFRKDPPTFSGPWASHAQAAWDHYVVQLPKKGISLRKPSPLVTSFKQAEGTLGRGEDRFPYFMMDSKKIGGYLRGYCNGKGSTVIAKESGGWWNRNVGTHEVGHHANNHSLCNTNNNGHPDEFKGIAPHWPYWTGRGDVRVFNYSYSDEETGETICIIFVEEASFERSTFDEKEFEDIAKKLLK